MAGYGDYANPVRQDPTEYIIGVHWGKAPPPGTPTAPSGVVGLVSGIFTDYESDDGQFHLFKYTQFGNQSVQLPIVYFAGNASFWLNAPGNYTLDLSVTFVPDMPPPPAAAQGECAILDANTFAPLAIGPVGAGGSSVSIGPASVGSGIYVVPAFRVIGTGPSILALATGWNISWQ